MRMNAPSCPDQGALSLYGACIADYKGEGTLELQDGEQINCNFEAGQLESGRVILLYRTNAAWLFTPVRSFQGVSVDGFRLQASGKFDDIPDLRDDEALEVDRFAVLDLEGLNVETNSVKFVHTARFGVTNLAFRGTETNGSVLPLALNADGDMTRVQVRRLEHYDRTIEHLELFRNIEVTAEIEVTAQLPGDPDSLTELIEDLCYILSIASGTKINWVYRDLYDQAGVLISRTHRSRITKPYCGLAIIDPRLGVDLKDFVEAAYQTYRTRKAQLLRNLADGTTFDYLGAAVDAYLNAKAEGDFLQVRGAKLAVAMEMLKAAFLGWSEIGLSEFIVPPEQFKDMEPNIKNCVSESIRETIPEAVQRAAVYANVKGLNRWPFRSVLERVFEHIQFAPAPRDITLFVNSRNKLVHMGLFYVESADEVERKKCQPSATKVEEFFFLVHFLDRVFMKLLGFSGRYLDWHKPGNPTVAYLP